MQKHKHLKIDSQSHLGIIDGIYAVGMTLLVFNLPDLFIKVLKLNELQFSVFIDMARWIFSYCSILFLLYEIWAFHRIINDNYQEENNRIINLITIAILSFVVLLPASQSLFIQEELQKVLAGEEYISTIGIHIQSSQYIIISVIFFLLSLLSLGVNFHLNSKSLIKYVSSKTFTRSIIFFTLAICTSLGIIPTYLYPLPIGMYVILSIFFDDLVIF